MTISPVDRFGPKHDATTRATMEFDVRESRVVNEPYSPARKAWADVPSGKVLGALEL